MRIQTFVIGSVLALALFLFAQKRPATSQPARLPRGRGSDSRVADRTALEKPPLETGYRLETVALSEKISASPSQPRNSFATRIDAPARLGRGQWTVDQIPAGRLIAPLVVLDVSASAKSNPDYEISVAGHRHAGNKPTGRFPWARS